MILTHDFTWLVIDPYQYEDDDSLSNSSSLFFFDYLAVLCRTHVVHQGGAALAGVRGCVRHTATTTNTSK